MMIGSAEKRQKWSVVQSRDRKVDNGDHVNLAAFHNQGSSATDHSGSMVLPSIFWPSSYQLGSFSQSLRGRRHTAAFKGSGKVLGARLRFFPTRTHSFECRDRYQLIQIPLRHDELIWMSDFDAKRSN
jgi:hypothetical protein